MGKNFGLYDVKVALMNADGSYGAAVDVDSARVFVVRLNTVNGTLEGDDEITDAHARAISANLELEFGGPVQFDVLAAITGKSSHVYAEGMANQATLISFDNFNFPYFAVCGRSDQTIAGDDHVYLPKVKIMEGFEVSFQYGQYSIPRLTAMGLRKVPWNIFSIVEHTALTEVVIPPVLPS